MEKKSQEDGKKRKIELIEKKVRRKFFQAENGPRDVFSFGKYAGRNFAEVFLKDASCVKWALGLVG